MTEDDPYQYAESLDNRTVEYARKSSVRFREEFGNVDPSITKEAEEYNRTKVVFQALVRDSHILTAYSEGDRFFAAVDGKEFYSTAQVIHWIEASDDVKRVAVFESQGSDMGTLTLFRNWKAEETLTGDIREVAFTKDSYYLNKTFLGEVPPDGGEANSHRVMLGGKVVFGKGLKPNEFIRIFKSGDKAMVTVGDWNSATIFCGQFEDPASWTRICDVPSPVKPLCYRGGEVCYLEKAKMGAIRMGARTLIESGEPIEDCVAVSGGFLVVHLKDAKVVPALYDLEGKLVRRFEQDIPMGLRCIDSDEDEAVIGMQSFGIPYSIHRFRDGRLSTVEENRVLDLEIGERWAKSTGPDIHYFLVENNGDGKKVLAYGYGGYNITLSPRYTALYATLLRNGIAVAQANLRGGGEYGEEWHLSGIRERKQGVFDDFMAVISQLKEEGRKVVAMGESNGGLLVGSVLTQKPQLIDGAVIGNPVLDMMRFHRMSVGRYWTKEFGDPDNPEDAAYLMKYSPYHHIGDADYPMVLLFSRLHDDRVHPAHAIKFHMKLAGKSEKAYLRLNSSGGHAGITINDRVVEVCENYSFISRCFQSV